VIKWSQFFQHGKAACTDSSLKILILNCCKTLVVLKLKLRQWCQALKQKF